MAVSSFDVIATPLPTTGGVVWVVPNLAGVSLSGVILQNRGAIQAIVQVWQGTAQVPIATVTIPAGGSLPVSFNQVLPFGGVLGLSISPTVNVYCEVHGSINSEGLSTSGSQRVIDSGNLGLASEPPLGLIRKHNVQIVNASKNVGTFAINLQSLIPSGSSFAFVFGRFTTGAGNAATFTILDTPGNIVCRAVCAGYATVTNDTPFSALVPLDTLLGFQYTIANNNTTLVAMWMSTYWL